MTQNKETVKRYNDGFASSNYEQISSCLAEDVVWIMPGAFHLKGVEVLEKLKSDVSAGSPDIMIGRIVEEDDVVVVEAEVRFHDESGGQFAVATCEIFAMESGKIKQLTTYLMQKPS